MYGAWLAIGEVLLWLLTFDLGLPHLLIQRVGSMHAKGDHKSSGQFFATGVVVLSSVAIVLYLAVYILAPHVCGLFLTGLDADTLVSTMRLAAVATSVTIVNYAVIGLARAIQETSTVNTANVLGTLAGFAVTYLLLQSGRGLEAIAWGMVVRATIGFLGGLYFVTLSRSVRPIMRALGLSSAALRDYREHVPSLLVSGGAYALMTHSHVTIIAFAAGPQMAVVYSVTRRGAELVKAVLDMVTYSCVGGFAHAWAANATERRLHIHSEIVAVYFAVAAGLTAAYVSANSAFVGLWVGDGYFGGLMLTALMGAAVTVSSWSHLELNLLRSTGDIKSASYAMAVECVARVTLMAAFATTLGLIGVPIAVVLTSSLAATWAIRKVGAKLDAKRPLLVLTPLSIGLLAGLLVAPKAWVETGLLGLFAALLAVIAVVPFQMPQHKYALWLAWRKV